MALLKLDIISVRNIQSASISLSPTVNLITGANASGKSSLLEAVYLLGRAKSFRTSHTKQAIAFEQAHLIVAAQNCLPNDFISTLGIQIDHQQTEIRIDGETSQKADLAYSLPVQLIHPKSYRILDGGPQIRREFLDWGVFNHNKSFLPHWRKFSKALKQRNALLKSRQTKQLSAWDKELVESGAAVNDCRHVYMQALQPVFLEMAMHFLGLEDITLKFLPGWDDKHKLGDLLQLDLEKDLRYGYTHSGPHRADFLIHLHKRPVKDYLSRGQIKLFVLALLLSQVKLLHIDAQRQCCVLIDDLCSELDTVNRLKLVKYLTSFGCQVLMTATDIKDFGDLSLFADYKMFHVEHGSIKPL